MTNETEILEKLDSRRYNPDYIPQPDVKLFTIKEKLVGSAGNWITLTGLPKTGKSFFLSAITASAFTPLDIFGMKLNLPVNRKKICYLDTESSEYDMYRQMERIRKFIRIDRLPSKLDAFNVREDNNIVILSYITAYLDINPDCSVLIADGILDLIINYNDETESRRLIQFFKMITKKYNILVITVLHLGKKDNHTLGTLGSASDRYAQSTLVIEKNKENQTFTIQSRFMRSDLDFDPIAIQFYDGEYREVDYQAPKEINTRTKK
jgi:archaellum biogenesis ATPase FlaH